jgi:SAM-dependent methyltransferase
MPKSFLQAPKLHTSKQTGLKNMVRENIAFSCLYYLVSDMTAGIRLKRGNSSTESGSRHSDLQVHQSLSYIENTYTDYLKYANIDRFSGRVAEVGPGDNFGVALMCLANGASEYHAIDRFHSNRDPAQQKLIYQALVDKLGCRNLFDTSIDETMIRNFSYHVGQPAETFFQASATSFDAIVSRAVLEHLYDPVKALDSMYASLNPGGLLVHRIDLRDHGLFPAHNPLTFLTMPNFLYSRMVRNTGRPNRVRISAYRAWLQGLKTDYSLKVTRLAGVNQEIDPTEWGDVADSLKIQALDHVTRIRPFLASTFMGLDDADLACTGCVLVVGKPR